MKKICFIFIFSLSVFSVFADNIDNIRKEIEKIEKNINEKKKQITGIKKEENDLYRLLNVLESEMNKIKTEYNKNSNTRNVLMKNIQDGQNRIKETQKELNNKNAFMRKKLVLWQRYNSGNAFEQVMSGDNLLEIIDKQEDLKKIIEYDQGLIKNLGEIKNRLEIEKRKVEGEKRELDGVITNLSKQQNDINKNLVEKNRIMNILKSQEKQVSKEVKTLSTKKKNMEKEIERIIKERAKKAKSVKEKSYEASTIVTKIGNSIIPLNGETVVGYGQSKAGNVKSSGIEIKGKMGDRVKSCNDGEVIFTGKLENMGTVIIIDHGYGFVSVYGNLISSYVGNGANVKKGQNIGILGLSAEEREPILYFETRLRAKVVSPFNFVK